MRTKTRRTPESIAADIARGAKFRTYRYSVGKRQTEIADELDVCQKTISTWETGESPVPEYAWLVFDLDTEPTTGPPGRTEPSDWPPGRTAPRMVPDAAAVTEVEFTRHDLPAIGPPNGPFTTEITHDGVTWFAPPGATFKHARHAARYANLHRENARTIDASCNVIFAKSPRVWTIRTFHGFDPSGRPAEFPSFRLALEAAASAWVAKGMADEITILRRTGDHWIDTAFFPMPYPLTTGESEVGLVSRKKAVAESLWRGSAIECTVLARIVQSVITSLPQFNHEGFRIVAIPVQAPASAKEIDELRKERAAALLENESLWHEKEEWIEARDKAIRVLSGDD